MSARWATCPRCQVRFQTEAADATLCPACTARGSADSWYVVQNKQKIGPLSLSQMQQMSQSGKLKPEDMVLQEGARTWVPAAKAISQFGDTVSPSQAALVPPDTVDASRRTITFNPADTRSDPLAPSATPVPAVPGYEILGELGRGGMGVVYKARHTTLKRLVALKMILAGGHAAASELARFLAEAQAVARLQHPNIVQVHEIGEKDGLPYFSLEFVDGGTLAKRLAGTPLPPRDAAQLTVTLALAIEAAHQAGIIHRDLKPANVLLAGNAPSVTHCVPKIADFGLAKTLDDDSGQTRTGAIMGTPSYMSPEQASGQVKAIGPPTDVYALGAMLYEMFTGRPPFRAATIVETLEQVRSQEPVSPRSLQPSLPRDLETICLKCLHKELGKRYATAKELADDLQRYLNNQPILARPASVQERTLKFVKRNGLLVGSVSAIILALLIGIIAYSTQASRARAAEKEERLKGIALKESNQDLVVKLAELARRRGELRERLTYLSRALEYPEADHVQLLLDKARTYAALAEPDEVRKILDELQARDDLGKHEGSVLLLRGYSTMGNKTKEGFELIDRALAKELPPEERLFAQGLKAPTSPQAVELFRSALKEDTYHEPSRSMLSLMLFMLGRMDEAKEVVNESLFLYPDNPNFRILRMAILARNGNKKEALEILRPVKKQLNEAHYRVLETLIDFLEVAGRIDEVGGVDDQQLARMWARLTPDLPSVWPVAPGKVPQEPQEGAQMLMQLPPVLSRSLGELTRLFGQVMYDLRNETANAKLDLALRAHPEGTLYFVHGIVLQGQGSHRQAAMQFHTAARMPSIARMRRSALMLAALSEAQVALDKEGEVADKEMLAKCANTTERVMAISPIHPNEAGLVLKVLLKAKRFDQARTIVALWDMLGQGDRPVALRARMKVESGAGAHVKALEAADQLLKKEPKDAEALRVRASSLEEIRKTLKNAGE